MVDILDRAGVYEILRGLYVQESSFSDFLGEVSRRTLSNRLQELEKLGYIRRRVIMSHPIRAKYAITEKGREAFKKLVVQKSAPYIEDLFSTLPEKARKILSSYAKQK